MQSILSVVVATVHVNELLRPVHTDCATAIETQIFFISPMGYIGPYGSVHMETCGNSNNNPYNTFFPLPQPV